MAMSGVPIHNVYIDRCFQKNDRKSDSEFKYELAQHIQLSDKCAMCSDDVIIPVSWFNVDEDNKYIYIRRFEDLTNTRTDRIVPIEVSNHTFDSLTESLQEGLDTVYGSNIFTVSYDAQKLTISVQAESQSEVKRFTDEELKCANDWSGPAYNSSNLQYANELLGSYITPS